MTLDVTLSTSGRLWALLRACWGRPSAWSVLGQWPRTGTTLVSSAGDGLLLPVLRDRHVSGVHGGGARRAPHRAPQGRGGAAQGFAPGAAGRRQQKVCTPPSAPRLAACGLRISCPSGTEGSCHPSKFSFDHSSVVINWWAIRVMPCPLVKFQSPCYK